MSTKPKFRLEYWRQWQMVCQGTAQKAKSRKPNRNYLSNINYRRDSIESQCTSKWWLRDIRSDDRQSEDSWNHSSDNAKSEDDKNHKLNQINWFWYTHINTLPMTSVRSRRRVTNHVKGNEARCSTVDRSIRIIQRNPRRKAAQKVISWKPHQKRWPEVINLTLLWWVTGHR